MESTARVAHSRASNALTGRYCLAIKTAVVIAGAVARGAYEAGALAAILTRELADEDLPETLFVGTSAGAINAVLWAGLADGTRSVAQVGEAVCDVWASLKDTEVFAPVSSIVGASWKLLRGNPTHLLDTSPLADTVRGHFERLTITENVERGHVGGAAIAATFCGATAAGARSDIFYQARVAPALPTGNSALRYVPATPLRPEHVLASSAVPALFEPVPIDGAYYVDGGVRLNTPIAPAIAFGAQRIIIVSSHATKYPRPEALAHLPSASDALAMVLHSVFADKTIEDIEQLKRINRLVAASKATTTYRTVEHIVVSPRPGALAKLARSALHAAYTPRAIVKDAGRALRYGALETLVQRLGKGGGADELVSYILFDPTYFAEQLSRGREDAAEASSWLT